MNFLSQSFAIGAVLGVLSILPSANAQGRESVAVRTPVPVENFSGETWVGQYVADNASEQLYTLFKTRPGLSVLVQTYSFGSGDDEFCVANTGLTFAPKDPSHHPRVPYWEFSGGATANSGTEGKIMPCTQKALRLALNSLLAKELTELTKDLASSLPDGGRREKEPGSKTLMHRVGAGLSVKGHKYITNAMPDWFPVAFDYRHVTRVDRFTTIALEDGQKICFARFGLTARPPNERGYFVPAASSARARLLNKSVAQRSGEDEVCFEALFDKLVESVATSSSPLISNFIDKWALVGEPDLPAPTKKRLEAAVASWEKAQAQRQQAAARVERTAQASTQSNSCSVQCVNGDCIRSWPNGRQERFQAPRKFNPFNSQWEWDTSGC